MQFQRNVVLNSILFGIMLVVILVAGGCANEEAEAKLTADVDSVNQGESVLMNASDSSYDNLSWFVNDSPHPWCDGNDHCIVEFNSTGIHEVKIKVEMEGTQTGGGLMGELLGGKETQDEATYEVVVKSTSSSSSGSNDDSSGSSYNPTQMLDGVTYDGVPTAYFYYVAFKNGTHSITGSANGGTVTPIIYSDANFSNVFFTCSTQSGIACVISNDFVSGTTYYIEIRKVTATSFDTVQVIDPL